ncbi:hypothetical protein GCM10022221_39460 [Actinocorallia aurea]
MQTPNGSVGFFPWLMTIGDETVEFEFSAYDEWSSLKAQYVFRSFDRVSTSELKQRLSSVIHEEETVDIDHISESALDATLWTFSEAEPTSALATQEVHLDVLGSTIGVWDVKFSTPIHEFKLNGAWIKH